MGAEPLAALASWGEQVRRAVAAADALVAAGHLAGVEGVAAGDADSVRPQPDAILYCGMGGSAVGGDLCSALASTAPVVVHRGYGVPAWCGPRTLVVAASYSGNTAETLDAATEASRRGAAVVAVCSGGALAERGWPVLRVGGGLRPRYALGWMAAAPLAFLERLGVVSAEAGWREAVPLRLERRAADHREAVRIAEALQGALPVVWAASEVARRWVADLNENAKVPAHAAVLPEADHNEVVAWAAEGAAGRPGGRRVLVLLRTPQEDPRVAHRFELSRREVEGSFDEVLEVTAEGGGPAEWFFDLALLGSYVSCYLAQRRGVDPSATPALDRIKAAVGAQA